MPEVCVVEACKWCIVDARSAQVTPAGVGWDILARALDRSLPLQGAFNSTGVLPAGTDFNHVARLRRRRRNKAGDESSGGHVDAAVAGSMWPETPPRGYLADKNGLLRSLLQDRTEQSIRNPPAALISANSPTENC